MQYCRRGEVLRVGRIVLAGAVAIFGARGGWIDNASDVAGTAEHEFNFAARNLRSSSSVHPAGAARFRDRLSGREKCLPAVRCCQACRSETAFAQPLSCIRPAHTVRSGDPPPCRQSSFVGHALAGRGTDCGIAGVKVGDGILFGKVEVRLQGIAAREDRRGQVDAGGKAATAALERLADDQYVIYYLEVNREAVAGRCLQS